MCDADVFCVPMEKKKKKVLFQFKILKKRDTFKHKCMNIFNAINLGLLWQILLGFMAYGIPQGINRKVNCSLEMYIFHPLPLKQQLAKQ